MHVVASYIDLNGPHLHEIVYAPLENHDDISLCSFSPSLFLLFSFSFDSILGETRVSQCVLIHAIKRVDERWTISKLRKEIMSRQKDILFALNILFLYNFFFFLASAIYCSFCIFYFFVSFTFSHCLSPIWNSITQCQRHVIHFGIVCIKK